MVSPRMASPRASPKGAGKGVGKGGLGKLGRTHSMDQMEQIMAEMDAIRESTASISGHNSTTGGGGGGGGGGNGGNGGNGRIGAAEEAPSSQPFSFEFDAFGNPRQRSGADLARENGSDDEAVDEAADEAAAVREKRNTNTTRRSSGIGGIGDTCARSPWTFSQPFSQPEEDGSAEEEVNLDAAWMEEAVEAVEAGRGSSGTSGTSGTSAAVRAAARSSHLRRASSLHISISNSNNGGRSAAAPVAVDTVSNTVLTATRRRWATVDGPKWVKQADTVPPPSTRSARSTRPTPTPQATPTTRGTRATRATRGSRGSTRSTYDERGSTGRGLDVEFEVVLPAGSSKLGLGFRSTSHKTTVTRVQAGSAAAATGKILPHDWVVGVNGTDVRHDSKKSVIKVLRAAMALGEPVGIRFKRRFGAELSAPLCPSLPRPFSKQKDGERGGGKGGGKGGEIGDAGNVTGIDRAARRTTLVGTVGGAAAGKALYQSPGFESRQRAGRGRRGGRTHRFESVDPLAAPW